jgi:hypothetical protein
MWTNQPRRGTKNGSALDDRRSLLLLLRRLHAGQWNAADGCRQ